MKRLTLLFLLAAGCTQVHQPAVPTPTPAPQDKAWIKEGYDRAQALEPTPWPTPSKHFERCADGFYLREQVWLTFHPGQVYPVTVVEACSDLK